MDFEILNRETIYSGRAFGVQKVNLLLPNQKESVFDLVKHNGSVTIVPLDEAGNIWFVRQYRLGAESQLLELPAGVLEREEDPLVCAAREVREEIGMGAKELQFLGDFYLAPGYSSEHMFVFLATGLFPEELPHDEDEFLNTVKIPFPQVYEMAKKGELKDSKSLAALLLALPHLSIP
ncbi:MAG: ADP-ribose pyrophosphatase [Anaerolineaceae bacterium]|nr:ADP-ribose pyrophosphatase [Anaerolineaceae bacterium]